MSSQQSQSKREMPMAEVVRLIDLVNYQEGSLVSRSLVNRATGTVTLFAFDEGQGLSEHTAPFDAVAHLLEGEAVSFCQAATNDGRRSGSHASKSTSLSEGSY